MKVLKTSFYILFLLVISNSCSNDLDLTAEWKDIPIVYGVLEANAPVHYIRIEKAFIDPEIGPLVLAKEPDSLYYKDAIVEIINLDTDQRFLLEKVDAASEGFTREEGIFATSPNYLYKISGSQMPLAGGENLRLEINRGENKELVTAEAFVIPPMDITRPTLTSIRGWTEKVKQKVSWKPNSKATLIFDIEIVFKYKEKVNTPGSPTLSKEISWFPIKNRKISDEEKGNPQLTNEISGASFYQFIGETINNDVPAIRAGTSVDIIVHGGGQEIERYFTITFANSGITGAQDPPVYTNISAGGQGIFSSKAIAKFLNIQLELDARDSLLYGRFTKDLNFQ